MMITPSDWFTCTDCRSENSLVWTSEGDIVCRRCGLVKEGHCISEAPEWRSFEDEEDKSRVEILYEQTPKKASYIFKDMLHAFDDVMIKTIDEVYEITKDVTVQKRMVQLIVTCHISSTLNTRPFTPESICHMVDVPYNHKDFWTMHAKCVENIMHKSPRLYSRFMEASNKTTTITAIVRRLYDYDVDQWKLIRVANDIFSKTKDGVSSSVNSKFFVSVVFVACKALGYRIPKKHFVDMFALSDETIAKHEASIQCVLSKRHV